MSTTLECTIADLVAENHRLWTAHSEASNAVTAIKRAAEDAIAADPVIITLTYTKPNGEVLTGTVQFIDGEPSSEDEGTLVGIYILMEVNKTDNGYVMSEANAETWQRFREARQESRERSPAIRERVYREMGYEAAQAARDRAYKAADASSDRLHSAPISTIADAVAALEYIRENDEGWGSLGDRVIAFLKAA